MQMGKLSLTTNYLCHKGYHGLSSTNHLFLCHVSLSSIKLCTNDTGSVSVHAALH